MDSAAERNRTCYWTHLYLGVSTFGLLRIRAPHADVRRRFCLEAGPSGWPKDEDAGNEPVLGALNTQRRLRRYLRFYTKMRNKTQCVLNREIVSQQIPSQGCESRVLWRVPF